MTRIYLFSLELKWVYPRGVAANVVVLGGDASEDARCPNRLASSLTDVSLSRPPRGASFCFTVPYTLSITKPQSLPSRI